MSTLGPSGGQAAAGASSGLTRWQRGKAFFKFLGSFAKFTATVLATLALVGAATYTFRTYGAWQAGVVALNLAIVWTLLPLLYSFLRFEKLHDPGDWFEEADYLGAYQGPLKSHYSRIRGTLGFWKSKAASYRRLHNARVLWSLLSAVGLPVLIQLFDKSTWAKVFMTELTTWTGLLVSLAYTFRAEEKFQGYRQQESDFYDASRDFLDTTAAINAKQPIDAQKIADLSEQYLEKIRNVRRVARRVETGSPPSALP